MVLVSWAHFVPVKEKRDVPLQLWGPKTADARWYSSRQKDSSKPRYWRYCRRYLGRVFVANDLTLLPQAALHFDAQTHTRKMRWGYKPPTLFNYAVMFYPNVLVMLWSREAVRSLGTDTPWSERRRKEDFPDSTRGRPRHRSQGADQFRTLFSFSAFCYSSKQRKRKQR